MHVNAIRCTLVWQCLSLKQLLLLRFSGMVTSALNSHVDDEGKQQKDTRWQTDRHLRGGTRRDPTSTLHPRAVCDRRGSRALVRASCRGVLAAPSAWRPSRRAASPHRSSAAWSPAPTRAPSPRIRDGAAPARAPAARSGAARGKCSGQW